MRSIKRLFATVTAGFDGFVDQVENHEAVAEAVIGDIRRKAARLRVQLARVDERVGRLEEQRRQSLEEAEKWRERALRVAEEDDERGLYCARQHRDAQSRATQLATQIGQHKDLRANVQHELDGVEDKLSELQLKKSFLASRGAHADAAKAVAGACCDESDADGVFDRWETQITQNEYLVETRTPSAVDPLRAEFEEQERDAALREQLSEWRAGGGKGGKSDGEA